VKASFWCIFKSALVGAELHFLRGEGGEEEEEGAHTSGRARDLEGTHPSRPRPSSLHSSSLQSQKLCRGTLSRKSKPLPARNTMGLWQPKMERGLFSFSRDFRGRRGPLSEGREGPKGERGRLERVKKQARRDKKERPGETLKSREAPSNVVAKVSPPAGEEGPARGGEGGGGSSLQVCAAGEAKKVRRRKRRE